MIGPFIKALRKNRKMTLADVSKETGLSISFISDLENSRTDPSLKTIKKLADCYKVPFLYIASEYDTDDISFDTVSRKDNHEKTHL